MSHYGRYELLEQFATGGMAEVFHARAFGADGFEKDVVIKRILPAFAADPQFQQMLLEEARVTARLQHANIVQVLDYGRIDDTCFIALERVEGIDGRQLLQLHDRAREWIPFPVAVYVISEVLEALHYAHRRLGADGKPLGIVHRDVSPANILLSFEGEVKLGDFGIARARNRASHTQVGQVRGKPRYMSIEQAGGQEIDGRSDLFSAGLVLHELLTGKPAYPGRDTLDEIIADLLNHRPVPSRLRPDVPPALDEIVRQMCHPERGERYSSCLAARDALLDFASEKRYRLTSAVLADHLRSLGAKPRRAQVTGSRPFPPTRVVRMDDVDGVARFTSGGTPAPAGETISGPTPAVEGAGAAAPPADDARTFVVPSPSTRASAAGPTTDARTLLVPLPGNAREPAAGTITDARTFVVPAPPREDTPQLDLPPRARSPVPLLAAGSVVAVLLGVLLTGWMKGAATPASGSAAVSTLASATPVATPEATAAEVRVAEKPPVTPAPRTPPRATPTRSTKGEVSPVVVDFTAADKAGDGWISISANPNGDVTVDGIPAGRTPLFRYKVRSGMHVVTVTDGTRSASTTILVRAGETSGAQLTLR